MNVHSVEKVSWFSVTF